jgi:hypothetical protein
VVTEHVVMVSYNSAQEKITERLMTAVEQLRRDVRAVELWADALHAFAQPIPEYRPLRDYLLPQGESAHSTRHFDRGSES